MESFKGQFVLFILKIREIEMVIESNRHYFEVEWKNCMLYIMSAFVVLVEIEFLAAFFFFLISLSSEGIAY